MIIALSLIMVSKKIIKLATLLRQNIFAFFIVILWFLINYLGFLAILADPFEALTVLFFFTHLETPYGNFYMTYSDFVIFGILFSLITIELFRKYNPEDTCRKYARKFSDHAIIIGYNHLGKRIAKYLEELDKKCVIIEIDQNKIQDLIDKEDAVIHDDALLKTTLIDAGIEQAKAVYVLSDNLELQMVVNHHVRRMNETCKLILRIYEDDIAEIFEPLYNAGTISTSKNAAKYLLNEIKEKNFERILITGVNHITARIINHITEFLHSVQLIIIEENEDKVKNLLINKSLQVIDSDLGELDPFKQIELKKVDCVINMNSDISICLRLTKKIRDFNPHCKIFNRFFLDNVASVLEDPPFNSEIISSSKFTIEYMKNNAMLSF